MNWQACAPPGGWKPRTYYIVRVTWSPHNVAHHAILYTGFLHDGAPGGYSCVFNPTYDERCADLAGLHSVEVVSVIEGMDQP